MYKTLNILIILAIVAALCSCITSGPGEQGPAGQPGQTGTTGQTGDTGQVGTEGQTGDTGQTGRPGQTGDTGDTGRTGQTGDTGPTAIERGMDLYTSANCASCHTIGNQGGSTGPNLTTVGLKMTAEELFDFVKNPKAVNPDAEMPASNLPDEDIRAIAEYLFSLK